jgi:hypothetical protein
MVDSLSKNIGTKRVIENILRLKIVQGTKSLNHSQFSNDTLFLGESSIIITFKFNQILDSFIDAFGRAFNSHKFQKFGWNTNSM